MSKNGQSDQLRLGFMGALDVDGRGHVGGLLVTSHNGRPLEFQCTTPVKPDRTQEILYGRRLRPWLLGELIGATLLQRVSIQPDLVVVRDPDMLELRCFSKIPVACLEQDEETKDRGGDTQVIGGRTLRFHEAHSDDGRFVESRAHLIPGQADLEEPLDRVHDALTETVKSVLSR